jgi:vitamin B12 transporter
LSRQGAFLRGLAALLLAHSSTALAADEERTVELEEVEVRLPRTEASADPTASATIVDAKKYQGEAKTVAELAATAPGVAVQDYGGLGHLSTISIRGATADGVKVLLDGLPLNTAAGGGVDLSSIPQYWVDRIEVVRGAEGAYYGAGALGGVVNVVTRPAAAGTWSAQATGGSFLTYSLSADASVGSERWATLGALSLEGTNGRFPYLYNPTPEVSGSPEVEQRRDHNAVLKGGGLVKAWRSLGDGRLDLLVQLSGGKRDLPGWPGAPTPLDWERDARAAAVARLSHSLGSGLTLSTELSVRHDQLDTYVQQLGEHTYLQRDVFGGARAELSWMHATGTLTASASVGAEQLAADSMGDPHQRSEVALTLADETTFASGRLRVAPALRFERIGLYADLSGKLGSTLRLWGPLSLRASVGRTFRVPSFAELFLQQGILEPNPELVPEVAWSADTALVADGRFGLASIGAFASLYRDLIVYEPGSFHRLKPFNDGKALVRGLEVEFASTPVPQLLGLSGSLAYTLLATETLRGAPETLGKELPYRPRHRLYARLALEQPWGGSHVEVHWVGSQFHDAENARPPVPASTTFNAGASLRISSRPHASLSLEVKNLLDDRTLQDAFGNPLPARTVLLTLRVASPNQKG